LSKKRRGIGYFVATLFELQNQPKKPLRERLPMFKVPAQMLQGVVSSLAKGARKAKLGELFIFIRTQEDYASFYFNGDQISVEKRVPADIEGELEVATTVGELSTKVAALPSDEEIICQLEGNLLKLKWGRNSEISVELVPQTSPLIEIPEMVEEVKWGAGSLHGISRVMPPFTANPNSQQAKTRPSVSGPNFAKDPDTGEIYVRATDAFKAVTIKAAKLDWFKETMSIETSTMSAVSDVLPEDAEITVGLNEGKTMIVFQCGTTTAVARTLLGAFPNIDGSYVNDAAATWRFDRLDLIDLCKRVKILSPQKPILEFRIKGGKVHAIIPKSLDQQVGVHIEGTPCEFSVNATYLEMTAHLYRSEELILYVNGADRPITIRQEGSDDIRSLVLPTRLV
jgi:DNA polymerase III subunit beta